MNKSKYLCKICKREFEKIRGLSAHINFKHNLSSKEYYDKHLKTYNDGICENENCNNKTSWFSLPVGYRRFCSDVCANTSKIRIEQERIRMLKKHFNEPEFRVKISKNNKEFWNKPENKVRCKEHAKKLWMDEKIREKMISSLRSTCSTLEYKEKKRKIALEISKRPQWRKNVSEGTKSGWNKVPEKRKSHSINMKNGGAAHCNMFIKNPSKPQVELFKLVSHVFPYPVMNYPCGRYSIDIAIPSLNLAFEYDGSYWHKDIKYHKKRQRFLENEGWIFYRYIDRIPSIVELKGIFL